MAKAQKSVREFATIGFLLLAVLFGMQIMVFVFGSMNAIDVFDDVTQTVTNESGAFVNITGYTISQASQSNFSGGATATEVWANVSGTAYLVPSANYTLNAVTGVLTNATNVVNSTQYEDLNISYTTQHKTDQEVGGDRVNNDSLNAIGNYSTQAGTQFTTLGIAITLILLVAVFLFFWVAFMGKGKKGDSSPGGFS